MIANVEKCDFKLDERVWIVCSPNHIMNTTIKGFYCLIYDGGKKGIIASPRGVRVDNFILDDYFKDMDDSNVPLKYLTKDEEKAIGWMKFYPVSMTDEEWLLSIGDRDKEENEKGNIEDGCELGQCCASISNIRDQLTACKEKGGIIGWEVEQLQLTIDESHHDMPGEHKLLDKIFKQLNVSWE